MGENAVYQGRKHTVTIHGGGRVRMCFLIAHWTRKQRSAGSTVLVGFVNVTQTPVIPEEETSPEEFLHQTDPWACLWGIVLMVS